MRGRLTPFGSYVVLTEPVPELLEEIGWTGGEAIVDGRMFLHYFRTTEDGRVLMGSGSGPIGRGGADRRTLLRRRADGRARRAEGSAGCCPGSPRASVERAWGGPIDVSSDQLPFFGTVPGTRIHYGAGYSGNGVGPSWLGGQILASLVARRRRRVDAPAARRTGCRRGCRRSRSATSAAPPCAGRSSRSRRRTRRAAAPAPLARGVAALPRAARPADRDALSARSTRSRSRSARPCLHALWNVLLARTRDPQAATAAAFCMAVVIWAPVAAVRWRVEAGAWKWIAASAAFELAYVLLLSAAYARAPLSVFYPIARGLAPVLVLLVAVLALGAATSATQAIGVCAVGAGILLVRGRRPDRAATALRPRDRGDDRRLHADRQHRRHARRPAGLPRGGDGRARDRDRGGRRRPAGRPALRAGFRRETLLIAPLTLAPYALTLYALRLAPAAPVAAVRETSVVIVAAPRRRSMLKERVSPWRLGGRGRRRRGGRPARRLDN